MDFFAAKWIWLYAGTFLMLSELLIPGFVVFFFGLAAMAVSGLLFFFDLSVVWQLAWFSVFSVVFIVLFRNFLFRIFMKDSPESENADSDFVGRVAEVKESIGPGVTGRVLLRDSGWDAVADEEIAVGTKVRIVSQKNLTLKVEKI